MKDVNARVLTRAEKKALRMLSNEWREVIDMAQDKGLKPMARGSFSGTLRRLWLAGVAEMKIENNRYWYRKSLRGLPQDNPQSPRRLSEPLPARILPT